MEREEEDFREWAGTEPGADDRLEQLDAMKRIRDLAAEALAAPERAAEDERTARLLDPPDEIDDDPALEGHDPRGDRGPEDVI